MENYSIILLENHDQYLTSKGFAKTYPTSFETDDDFTLRFTMNEACSLAALLNKKCKSPKFGIVINNKKS